MHVPEIGLVNKERKLKKKSQSKASLQTRVTNNVHGGGHTVARKKAVEEEQNDRNPSNCSEFAWSRR
jgi:hypothetical protein